MICVLKLVLPDIILTKLLILVKNVMLNVQSVLEDYLHSVNNVLKKNSGTIILV